MTVAVAEPASSAFQRAMALVFVVLSATVFEIHLTNVAVVLPHMQGTFSATHDQISWVVTSFFVGMTLSFACSGWAADRFGRKRVFLVASACYTVATLFCGLATGLAEEVFWRFALGAFGGALMPLSQAIVLDTFPRRQMGMANAIWGIGVMVGPAMGPTIGGYITEHLTWPWIFFGVVPFAVIALIGSWVFVRETESRPERPFDLIGFTALVIGLVAAQLIINRGERLDWFESPEIIIEAAAAAGPFYVLVVHSMTTKAPFFELALFRDRNAATGLFLVVIWGFMLHSTVVLLSLMMQELRGFPAATIGLLLSPRGFGVMAGMFLAGWAVRYLDPRHMIAFGLLCLAVTGWAMSKWTLQVGAWEVVWTSSLQGFGTGFSFVPLNTKTFSTLARRFRTEGLTLFNLLLFSGIGAGIAVAVNVLTRSATINRANLTEYVTPYNQALRGPLVPDFWDPSSSAGLAAFEVEITRQANMIGYLNNFRLVAILALLALPLVYLFSPGRIEAKETEDD